MVFQGQSFNELSEDALSFILQSDQLRMDEEDILAKVTEWATVNSVSTHNTHWIQYPTCIPLKSYIQPNPHYT